MKISNSFVSEITNSQIRPLSSALGLAAGPAFAAVLSAVVFLSPVTVMAQGAASSPAKAPAAPAKKAPKNIKIPALVLSGLLSGTPESLFALKQYLAAVGGKPADVTARAIDVINQIKSSGLVTNTGLIIETAQRIADAVKETLASLKVMEVRIDKTFSPSSRTIALDFGPADGEVQKGFKRILPNDPMFKGSRRAVRRPENTDQLLSDGIAGAKSIRLDVPDGEYRVTLMTESLGDAARSLSPFGQNIIANGKNISVMQATPEHWLKQSILSNKGNDGFKTANSRVGGAITMTVLVSGGELALDFKHHRAGNALQTYLTGMIVQPVEERDIFTIPENVEPVTSPENQLAQEAKVASSIAGLLEEEEPAAGPPPGDDDPLPPPVVEATQTASPS